MIHEVKIIESLIPETEIIEKLLKRSEGITDELSNVTSFIFGKNIQAEINWQSLYYLIQQKMLKKDNFPTIAEYYAYVKIDNLR